MYNLKDQKWKAISDYKNTQQNQVVVSDNYIKFSILQLSKLTIGNQVIGFLEDS